MYARFCIVAAIVCSGVYLAGCGDSAGESPMPDTEDADVVEDAAPEVEEDIVEPPDIDFPPPVVEVVTVLEPSTITAGDRVPVSCRLIDAEGTEFPATSDRMPSVIYEPDGSFVFDDEERPMAIRAGEAIVTCAVPTLGLIDETPEVLTIEPADASVVITTLDKDMMPAGETATATCEAWDEWGNPTDASSAEVVLDTSDNGVMVAGRDITIEPAGVYTAACQIAGASSEGALLEVVPGPPANLLIARSPDQSVYAIGQVIEILTTVTDEFGNVIDNAVVDVISNPPGSSFGDDRFRYDTEGVYTVTATVAGPTLDDMLLQQETTIVVNSTGPSVFCAYPQDGTMIDHPPGTAVAFEGEVADTNGVNSVEVNGQMATLQSDGTFSASVPTVFGINFVDIVATDQFGEENSRTCAYLVSEHWNPENQFLDGNIALRLIQRAIDDGNPSDLDSLNDILHTVLNSQGLVNTLDSALSAQSPFINRCVQDVCLPLIGCSCVYRLRVDYRDIDVNGPNTTSLNLVSNGLRATATVRDVVLDIDIGGTISTSGTVTVSSVSVDLTFDLQLQNGTPRISVRRVNSVTVGNINTNFSGLAGWVLDLIVDIFQGTVRNLVRDQIRSFIESNFDQILDGLFSSLDISNLGSSFSVPRLDGGGSIGVNFGVRFSSLAVSSSRALFGVGTRFTTTSAHARPSLGVPLPTGNPLLDPTQTTNARPVGVAVYIGLLNQVLHTLWRGGFFDADVGGLVGGVPAGTTAQLETSLPPVATLEGDDVQLSIGGMRVTLVIPGVIDDPLTLSLGAVATSGIQLQNNDLVFQSINIDQLYFSADDLSLDSGTRMVLENFLRDLLQQVLLDAVNNGLPALPIPSFQLPQSLAAYGLPAGASLGILNPALQTTLYHFVLTGAFGIQ